MGCARMPSTHRPAWPGPLRRLGFRGRLNFCSGSFLLALLLPPIGCLPSRLDAGPMPLLDSYFFASPTPSIQPVEAATRTVTLTATVTAEVRRRPRPRSTPIPDPGRFSLKARRKNGLVHLRWPPQPGAQSYEVLVGLVPGATLRRAPDGEVAQPAWNGQPGLPGVTYYFRVRARDADGAELSVSRLRAVRTAGGSP